MDFLQVIGMDTTHGYARRLYEAATDSAVIVKVLQDLGGIPFVKTNVRSHIFNVQANILIMNVSRYPKLCGLMVLTIRSTGLR